MRRLGQQQSTTPAGVPMLVAPPSSGRPTPGGNDGTINSGGPARNTRVDAIVAEIRNNKRAEYEGKLIKYWQSATDYATKNDVPSAARNYEAAQLILEALKEALPNDPKITSYKALIYAANSYLNCARTYMTTSGYAYRQILETLLQYDFNTIISRVTNLGETGAIRDPNASGSNTISQSIKNSIIAYTPRKHMDDIIGNERGKGILMATLAARHLPPEIVRVESGLPFIALIGPAGTGKTVFAEATALIMKKKVALIKNNAFVSQSAGVGEQAIVDFFEAIPTLFRDYVILLDEADGYWRARTPFTEAHNVRLVTTALPMFDRLADRLAANTTDDSMRSFMFIIANTELDEAILRRCIRIDVNLPDTVEDYDSLVRLLAIQYKVTVLNISAIASAAFQGRVSPALVKQIIETSTAQITNDVFGGARPKPITKTITNVDNCLIFGTNKNTGQYIEPEIIIYPDPLDETDRTTQVALASNDSDPLIAFPDITPRVLRVLASRSQVN